MSAFLVGSHAWTLCRRAGSIFLPHKFLNSPPVSSGQREQLSRIQAIIESFEGVSSDLSVVADSRGSVTFYGTKANPVIGISVSILQGLVERQWDKNKYFLEAYHQRIDQFSDIPAKITQRTRELETLQLEGIIGLHQHCRLMLSDEELRFVMAHEIAGHCQHDDNVKMFALVLTVTVLAQAIFSRIFKETSFMSIAAVTVVLSRCAQVLASRQAERNADTRAIQGSERAREGAKSLFKRYLIAEEAQKELDRRRGDSHAVFDSLSGAFSSYPSTRERYEITLSTQ